MKASVKYFAPWLAAAAIGSAVVFAPIASAAATPAPAPTPTPFESGADPLVPANVGGDPDIPFHLGVPTHGENPAGGVDLAF